MTGTVVTGMGALCSLGRGAPELMQALHLRKSGLEFENIHGYPTALGRVGQGFLTPDVVGDATHDRATLMALEVAQQAVSAAKLDHARSERTGVFWGVGLAGSWWIERTYADYFAQPGMSRPSPWTVPAIMPNAASAAVAMRFGARGACWTYANACASSALALGQALIAIERGDLDVAIVGGSDSMLVPGMLHAWTRMRVLAKTTPEHAQFACRVFDVSRKGLCLAEGAASLVLESESHARARGAQPLAAMVGFGQSCDATDMTEPTVEGQVLAMRRALSHAGLSASDIGYVNAHGTGTKTGDGVELQALRELLGHSFSDCPVSSVKSAMGHAVGAAGALEAVVSVAALQEQWLPPTAFLCEIDPEFSDAFLVQGDGLNVPGLQYVMSNSFGFGGTNAALIFARI